MYCQNCGKEIPDGVKFCPGCGAQQAAAGPAPGAQESRQQSYAQPEPKKHTGAIIAVIAIIAIIAAALLGYFVIYPALSNGGPSKDGPWAELEWRFKKNKSFNDIIDNGQAMADLVLGKAESEIDAEFFEGDDRNGSGYYVLSDYLNIDGYNVDCSLYCADSPIHTVEFFMWGDEKSLERDEFERFAKHAISVFGENYDRLEEGDAVQYEWEHVHLAYYHSVDGRGAVGIQFRNFS